MTVWTFLALWACLNIVLAGIWGMCVLFADVHQRGLARVHRGDSWQPRINPYRQDRS